MLENETRRKQRRELFRMSRFHKAAESVRRIHHRRTLLHTADQIEIPEELEGLMD